MSVQQMQESRSLVCCDATGLAAAGATGGAASASGMAGSSVDLPVVILSALCCRCWCASSGFLRVQMGEDGLRHVSRGPMLCFPVHDTRMLTEPCAPCSQ